jgi:ABC-2 type transport system permease protein
MTHTAVFKGKIPTVEDRESRRTGFLALYRKEFADYFRSLRFMIILLLIAGVGIASVYMGSRGFQDVINGTSESAVSTDFMFLNLFVMSGKNFWSFATIMMLLGPVVGLMLGFDAINGERSHRTLSRLLAQPIYRDAVVNAKFLAGVTVIAIMVFSLGFVISGGGMLLIGLVPTLEELLRILAYLFFTVVYISLFLALSQLLSLLFRHAATSALTGIAIWLFFVLFLGLIAGAIADAVYPTDNITSLDTQSFNTIMSNMKCEEAINRISPMTLYGEAASAILNPSMTSVTDTMTISQMYQSYSAVSGNLPIGQSLLLVWPHLTGLVALTMICFIISYVVFMKQEIRAD